MARSGHIIQVRGETIPLGAGPLPAALRAVGVTPCDTPSPHLEATRDSRSLSTRTRKLGHCAAQVFLKCPLALFPSPGLILGTAAVWPL